jgi:DNA-binding transcriptional MocR family regulator
MHAMSDVRRRYANFQASKRTLDLTRGKPSDEQLAITHPLFEIHIPRAEVPRLLNYGHIDGLPEARALFAPYLGVPVENTMVLGNSSLAVMHDLVVQLLLSPLPGLSYSWSAWRGMDRMKPTMLCPVPGYDRHHTICERYGIDMIPVPMTKDGPDMEVVRREVESRGSLVGMWCSPRYSNPTGVTYSAKVVRELASMKTARGFRIFWDDAYRVHDLEDEPDEIPNFFELCERAGNADRAFIVGSTSKITSAGSGLALLGLSQANRAWYLKALFAQTIGQDKANQWRHVQFLKDMEGVRALMREHRAIVKPKFDGVAQVLRRELTGIPGVWWEVPRGGYFVSLYVPGHAKQVVHIASEAGVKLTPAGAAYPRGIDPADAHIRLAPTYPPLEDVEFAMQIVALSVRLALGR